jgi:hypothetical protein
VAGRQSRNLAAHIPPPLAERPLSPRRALRAGLLALFLLLGGGVFLLNYNNARYNR